MPCSRRLRFDARALCDPGAFRWVTPAIAAAVLIVAAMGAGAADGGASGASPASVGSPFAEPVVVSGDAVLSGRRATTWAGSDGSTMVLLEGEAGFAIEAYAFSGSTAVARIETERLPGRVVRHVWVYVADGRAEHASIAAWSGDKPLLVTASTSGGVRLETDSLTRGDGVGGAPSRAIVAEALARFDRRERKLRAASADRPGLGAVAERVMAEAARGRAERREAMETARAGRGVAVPELGGAAAEDTAERDAVLPRRGVVRFRADRFDYRLLAEGPVAVLVGDVTVLYQDYDRSVNLSLRADRAVVFLEEGAMEDAQGGAAAAGAVRGVYLEDHAVASDGSYTVRAPRVYYDAASNRAILLDAVMYSFDVRRELPLYVRAGVMRQTAAGTFRAEDATFTTSEFGEPHFGIGASRLTVRQVEPTPGRNEVAFEAKNLTLRAGDKPVFWLPYAAGRTGELPLRSARVGFDSDDGVQVETTWDIYALAGKAKPEGIDAEGEVDYLGERGPGLGGRFTYDQPGLSGEAEGYLLPLDGGADRLADRRDLEFDGDARGFISTEHRQTILGDWELSLRGDYVSDETFLEEFFDDEAYATRPYEASAYLKWQDEEQAFTALARVNANDFIPQLTELQAPGSVTDKLPELAYHRTGTPLLDGRLTWFSETAAGAIRQRFGADDPADRGFTTSQSQRLFGFAPTTTFERAAENRGLDDDLHLRLDTRQEIAAPLDLGPVNLTPFVVGRLTAYEDDFKSFNNESDRFRALGMGGVRLDTSFWKVYPHVRSRLLDLDGIRHVVTPRAEAFWIASNLDAGDLPTFDPDVESLAEGGGVRLGLLQTWETRRGGPGRSRSVDWVQLRTDLVLREDNEFDESAPIPRYVAYRPEYVIGGDHAYTELLWMVTDSLGFVGEATYAIENSDFGQWRVGATYDATPRLRTTLSYAEIDPIPSRVLRVTTEYRLTPKYRLGAAQSLDFADSADDSAVVSAFLERELPRWRLRVFGDVDQLESDYTVGVLLYPQGFDGGSGLTF